MKTTDVEFDTFNKTETMQTVQEYIDTLESRLALAVEALETIHGRVVRNGIRDRETYAMTTEALAKIRDGK